MWRKSRFCNGASACVEVAPLADRDVGVRDGKDPDGPTLRFAPEEWAAFTTRVREGEFDLETLMARAGDGSGVHGPARAHKAAVADSEAFQVSQ